MNRLLTVCPNKAEMVVLRIWTPPSTEDYLRRENLRLTHRISYLEDQVSELIQNREKLISLKISKSEEKQAEVFQKGSHIALLSSELSSVNSPKSNSFECSNHSIKVSGEGGVNVKSNKQVPLIIEKCNSSSIRHTSRNSGFKNHESENFQQCTLNGKENIKALAKRYEKEELSSFFSKSKWVKTKDNNTDNSPVKPTNNVSELKSVSSNYENSCSLSDLEWPKRKSAHHHSRMLDYSSETGCLKYKSFRDKKIETDEESSYLKISEPENGRIKPTPPKKPIRLSINRATSLQNFEKGYSVQNVVRKIRRSYKGEAPPPPISHEDKVQNHNTNEDVVRTKLINRCNVKEETSRTYYESNQPNFFPTSNYPSNKNKIEEKW